MRCDGDKENRPGYNPRMPPDPLDRRNHRPAKRGTLPHEHPPVQQPMVTCYGCLRSIPTGPGVLPVCNDCWTKLTVAERLQFGEQHRASQSVEWAGQEVEQAMSELQEWLKRNCLDEEQADWWKREDDE